MTATWGVTGSTGNHWVRVAAAPTRPESGWLSVQVRAPTYLWFEKMKKKNSKNTQTQRRSGGRCADHVMINGFKRKRVLPVAMSEDACGGNFSRKNVASLSRFSSRKTHTLSVGLQKTAPVLNLSTAESRRVHHPPAPAPYSEKHLFAPSHWLRGITVLDGGLWLAARAVHSRWRDVCRGCSSSGVARQRPLQIELRYCSVLMGFFICSDCVSSSSVAKLSAFWGPE